MIVTSVVAQAFSFAPSPTPRSRHPSHGCSRPSQEKKRRKVSAVAEGAPHAPPAVAQEGTSAVADEGTGTSAVADEQLPISRKTKKNKKKQSTPASLPAEPLSAELPEEKKEGRKEKSPSQQRLLLPRQPPQQFSIVLIHFLIQKPQLRLKHDPW